MRKISKKELISRFGTPDHESSAGNMFFFKYMLYARNLPKRGLQLKLLRLHKDNWEWFNEEENRWMRCAMQNIPTQKYKEFLDREIEDVLLK